MPLYNQDFVLSGGAAAIALRTPKDISSQAESERGARLRTAVAQSDDDSGVTMTAVEDTHLVEVRREPKSVYGMCVACAPRALFANHGVRCVTGRWSCIAQRNAAMVDYRLQHCSGCVRPPEQASCDRLGGPGANERDPWTRRDVFAFWLCLSAFSGSGSGEKYVCGVACWPSCRCSQNACPLRSISGSTARVEIGDVTLHSLSVSVSYIPVAGQRRRSRATLCPRSVLAARCSSPWARCAS